MKVFSSIGHFFATIGHGVVKAAQAVVSEAPKVEAAVATAQPAINAVVGAVFGPTAQSLENLAFQLLGNGVAVVGEAQSAEAAKGLSIPLDEQLIADLKALGPQFAAFAQALGISKPTNLPVTAPAAK